MTYELEYTDAIQESLTDLERQDAQRIIEKLDSILDFPGHYLDRLKNHPGYRLRISGFRVLIGTKQLRRCMPSMSFSANTSVGRSTIIVRFGARDAIATLRSHST